MLVSIRGVLKAKETILSFFRDVDLTVFLIVEFYLIFVKIITLW